MNTDEKLVSQLRKWPEFDPEYAAYGAEYFMRMAADAIERLRRIMTEAQLERDYEKGRAIAKSPHISVQYKGAGETLEAIIARALHAERASVVRHIVILREAWRNMTPEEAPADGLEAVDAILRAIDQPSTNSAPLIAPSR